MAREPEDRDERSAQQKGYALEQVRPDHGREAAVDGVGARRDPDQPDTQDDVYLEDRAQRESAGVENRRQRHEHVREHHERGHDRARPDIEAVFEVFGNGVDARLQKLRQEEKGRNDQGDGGRPFVAGDGKAQVVPAPGHTHELLGRDVGGDQGESDQPPGQLTSRKEVVFRGGFVPGGVQRYPDDDRNERTERDDVERMQRHGGEYRERGTAGALSGSEDAPSPVFLYGDDVVRIAAEAFHAGGAHRHAGHRKARNRLACLQHAVDFLRGDMAFHEIPARERRMTGGQIGRNPVSYLHGRHVGEVHDLNAESVCLEMVHPFGAAPARGCLVHGDALPGRGGAGNEYAGRDDGAQ